MPKSSKATEQNIAAYLAVISPGQGLFFGLGYRGVNDGAAMLISNIQLEVHSSQPT